MTRTLAPGTAALSLNELFSVGTDEGEILGREDNQISLVVGTVQKLPGIPLGITAWAVLFGSRVRD